ncbi:site-specific integrase [Actinomadura sp. KC216]|uniref:tyrosine-type recombinase/integrase n=1 Tax=Actinomadura sp. KC216 TaxID=2530370 RepID=UPI0010536E62|nr:tyrosine-type recombinase/integrase [Actinomadura sp. KC216]TDB91205.1 site-specific integrase [Actinomadura sp. KC216]
MDIRRSLLEGRAELPRVGQVRATEDDLLPFVVVDGASDPIEYFTVFLRELVLGDASPLTCRSYGHDLLRWWRMLALVEVGWDRATRTEVELLVGWLRSASNPQRRRSRPDTEPAGSVNPKTGKPVLRAGYAPSTINHALSVLSAFYTFHLHFGRGPLINPVPEASERRMLVAHRSPIEPNRVIRRAPLRQKTADRLPRSIPDPLWEELFAAMGTHRDRALLAFYVSSGARASELLGLRGGHVDWAGQRIWVISKGTRTLDPLPASPQAFRYLAWYFDGHGAVGSDEMVWRTLRGPVRPLSYWAMRRVIQRADERLGTNWTLHDLRHTAAARMAADPRMTLVEVQTVLRHRQLSTTERYLQPRAEELFDKLAEHYARPATTPSFTSGYDADDIKAVFGV